MRPRRSRLAPVTLALALAALTLASTTLAARRPSEWARMTDEEWQAIAGQWDESDDPEERKVEDQYEYERMMRARERGVPPGVRFARRRVGEFACVRACVHACAACARRVCGVSPYFQLSLLLFFAPDRSKRSR
jgi:hypothetical protein